jgi:hypothetical protein
MQGFGEEVTAIQGFFSEKTGNGSGLTGIAAQIHSNADKTHPILSRLPLCGVFLFKIGIPFINTPII